MRSFPDSFLWGVATSAQQIEGGYAEDGRGESIWDRFASEPGRIEDGSDPRVACDHYHRWRGDIDLLRQLGVGSYRFSIAWPRIQPNGVGPPNSVGLDYYDTLVDGLLTAGIRPFVTLYHWDLPQALQDRGGWAVRDTAEAFVEYAAAVSKRLGDRVPFWVTHNEPWCIATLGHEEGAHAPGHKDPAESLWAAHHVLLSHGWAVDVLRQNSPNAEIGIVLNLTPAEPASESVADRDAVRWFDGFFNRWYLDPVLRGRYPEDSISDRIEAGHLVGRHLPFVQENDLEDIAVPIDFLGVNYYSRVVMETASDGKRRAVNPAPADELTDMGWEVYPQGLDDLLLRLANDYDPKKIYITENGAAFGDAPEDDERIRDRRRVEFMVGHLCAAHRAISRGVPLAGYFAWSLLDNFEWAYGYTKRFGLYWVDYATQRRIPKDSAFWFRDVVTSNQMETADQTS